MNKQNVAYTYNGAVFSLLKEGNSDPCYNMDKPQRLLTEIRQMLKVEGPALQAV
jgi:hypothetical protein